MTNKLYDKDIIIEHTMFIDGYYYTGYVLDGGDYFNVHVIDEYYKQDEMNTLKLQEPKEVNIELDKAYLTSIILEHYLWHELYGYKGRNYNPCVDLSEYDLMEDN